MNKKQIEKKIEQLNKELKETSLEIVDDMCIMHDHGATLTCVISSDLYEHFQKLDKQHTKYHDKLEAA